MNKATLFPLAALASLVSAGAVAAVADTSLGTRFQAEVGEIARSAPAVAEDSGASAERNIDGVVRGNGDEVAIRFDQLGRLAKRQSERGFREAANVTRFQSEAFVEEALEIVETPLDAPAAEVSERLVTQAFERELSLSVGAAELEFGAAPLLGATAAGEGEVLENPIPGAAVLMAAGLAGLGGLGLRRRARRSVRGARP